MTLSLRTVPDPVLRQVSRRVENFPAIAPLVTRLFELADELRGAGMAANQVGEAVQVAVVTLPKERFAMVNPVIVQQEGQDYAREGCLSIPGVEILVPRSTMITVLAYDLYGRTDSRLVSSNTNWIISRESSLRTMLQKLRDYRTKTGVYTLYEARYNDGTPLTEVLEELQKMVLLHQNTIMSISHGAFVQPDVSCMGVWITKDWEDKSATELLQWLTQLPIPVQSLGYQAPDNDTYTDDFIILYRSERPLTDAEKDRQQQAQAKRLQTRLENAQKQLAKAQKEFEKQQKLLKRRQKHLQEVARGHND